MDEPPGICHGPRLKMARTGAGTESPPRTWLVKVSWCRRPHCQVTGVLPSFLVRSSLAATIASRRISSRLSITPGVSLLSHHESCGLVNSTVTAVSYTHLRAHETDS